MSNYRSNIFAIWLIFMLLSVAIVGALYTYGLLAIIFSDETYIAHGLSVYLVLSALYAGSVALGVSRDFKKTAIYAAEFNRIRHLRDSTIAIESLRTYFGSKTHVLKFLVFASTLMGLIGTAVGVIHLAQAMPVQSFSDPSMIVKTAVGMMSGFGTAFYTTLVGSISALWLAVVKTGIETEITRLYRLVLVEETV